MLSPFHAIEDVALKHFSDYDGVVAWMCILMVRPGQLDERSARQPSLVGLDGNRPSLKYYTGVVEFSSLDTSHLVVSLLTAD